MSAFANLSGFQIGVAMGAASIISIGPNNLMLAREGLVGGRRGLVASLVAGSYTILVLLAILLAARSVTVHAIWQQALYWSGFGALTWFALQAFRTAAQRKSDIGGSDGGHESLQRCLFRVMRIVWANPLTYVELLLIPAAICQSLAGDHDRLSFAAALVIMSAICCYGYAYGGSLLARVLHGHQGIRLFDLLSGILLSVVLLCMVFNLVKET
ncbi:LysE family transporter [Rhizobium laguerreae]|uniref:LysE family transporter n=1 Tax=Rhizobium laguerreae TaxID=1076926 RepID=A0A6N9ZM18_9HYPH|nr:LysE family transporter [Rhizobium laguerreae]NEH94000.1 LysE family transporter [Rhizobium laguerreae]